MKRTFFFILMSMCATLSVFAQRGNQKWYNTAIGLRIEGGAGSAGTLGPTFEKALSNTTSLEFMVLSNLSTGIEGVGMHKWIKTIPDVPAYIRWYFGAGVHVGTWGTNNFAAGPDGLLGIGISISDIPVNLCLDWHPSIDIGGGFNAAKFGFSIRYIVE